MQSREGREGGRAGDKRRWEPLFVRSCVDTTCRHTYQSKTSSITLHCLPACSIPERSPSCDCIDSQLQRPRFRDSRGSVAAFASHHLPSHTTTAAAHRPDLSTQLYIAWSI